MGFEIVTDQPPVPEDPARVELTPETLARAAQ